MNWETKNNADAATVVTGGRDDVNIDQGLRAHMVRVYNVMTMGLGVTGAVAFAVANTPALYNVIFGTPLFWVAAFAPLAFLWFGLGNKAMMTKSAANIRGRFYVFAGLFGISMASLFMMYTGTSIVRVFFITSATFLTMSLWGYTTKKDLSAMGSFLMMGLVGIIIASIVNIFIASSMMHWIISILGVIIFTGMTAYDTQRIKESYSMARSEEDNGKVATMGALSLYLNFVLLFQYLMMFLGNRN